MKIDDLCVVCQPHPQVEWTESGLEKNILISYMNETKNNESLLLFSDFT